MTYCIKTLGLIDIFQNGHFVLLNEEESDRFLILDLYPKHFQELFDILQKGHFQLHNEEVSTHVQLRNQSYDTNPSFYFFDSK